MTARNSMLHVRVDEQTKQEATVALEAMGLSVSDAVRILLRRIVSDQAFPLELKVPNAATREAMAEADRQVDERKARFSDADAMIEALEEERGR